MLELCHISKTYKTSKGITTQALKDINVRFPKKGMVFILGKSGSGKSTLLNVIGGLDQADTGEVIIHGKSSKEFTQADYDAYRNTYIGFIFQEFYLMDEYTIEKNIALSLQLQQKEAKSEDIEAMLEKVGLSGFGSRYPNELSGGQKQRVAIARSLIKSPEILMADEPTGALDSSTGTEIFHTLKELSNEKLVIVVSHDEDAAQLYADRIITFADGAVISDTNDQVEDDDTTFKQIRSHLPLKDSFHLGFTCLKHKKIRLIFTILLTSFALLTLGLSDSVSNFNDADAQYKAMNDIGVHFVGIQRQYLDADGAVLLNYGGSKRAITQEQAKTIRSNNALPFANVYDSAINKITLESLGVNFMDLSVFETASNQYLLTEMEGFEPLQIKDVTGTYPNNHKEVAISSYLADILIEYGLKNQAGTMLHPASYEELIGKVQLPINDQWLTISGVVKVDLSEYASLKDISLNQMDEASYKLSRKLIQVVNTAGNKLYVKEGFISSLHLPKGNVLKSDMGTILFEGKNHTTYTNSIAYPTEAITYFDGTKNVSTDSLKKNEVILDINTMSNYFSSSGTQVDLYSESFHKQSQEEKEAVIKELANKMIGNKVTLSYQETNDDASMVFKEEVMIIGIYIPSDLSEETIFDTNLLASKELIEPHIQAQYYLGELLTNVSGNQAKQLLNTYNLDQEFAAHTVATNDVISIKGFAQFATKVFFYASIAFFCFAAALMMNFIMVSISYRKKEIGILRSIGARSMDVVKIFVWEALILALLSYVLTLIFLFTLSSVVNAFAMDTVGILISPIIITLRQPLLLAGTVLVIACIASCFPILRIARQRPIDAIKK